MTATFLSATPPVKSGSNSITTLAAPKPTGLVTDALMIAGVSVASQHDAMPTVPENWSLWGGFPALDNDGTIYTNLWVYYKYASASEPSTYSWGWDKSGGGIVSICAYTDARLVQGVWIPRSSNVKTIAPSITTSASAILLSIAADASGSTWSGSDTSRASDFRTGAASLLMQDTNGLVAANTYTKTMTGTVTTQVAVGAILAIESGGPPDNAGPDQSGVKPFDTVTLTGTGSSAYTQTGGSPSGIALGGSGNTRTFTAPATVGGTTLTFTKGSDTCTVTVIPHDEWMINGSGVLYPIVIDS